MYVTCYIPHAHRHPHNTSYAAPMPLGRLPYGYAVHFPPGEMHRFPEISTNQNAACGGGTSQWECLSARYFGHRKIQVPGGDVCVEGKCDHLFLALERSGAKSIIGRVVREEAHLHTNTTTTVKKNLSREP